METQQNESNKNTVTPEVAIRLIHNRCVNIAQQQYTPTTLPHWQQQL